MNPTVISAPSYDSLEIIALQPVKKIRITIPGRLNALCNEYINIFTLQPVNNVQGMKFSLGRIPVGYEIVSSTQNAIEKPNGSDCSLVSLSWYDSLAVSQNNTIYELIRDTQIPKQ